MERKERLALRKRYVQELGATDRVDKDMISESISNYIKDEISYEGKVCLDLGTNIGAFVKIALDGGASKVYGVECDLRNYNIVANNFASEIKANVVHAAVSGSDQDTLTIYKSNAKSNHSSTSILKRNNKFRDYDEVKNYHIDELLREVKPQIIKIDIEGAEYDIIESIIDYKPEVLFIELHGDQDNARSSIQRLTERYNNNEVSEIIIFGGVGGYDCLFYD